MNPSLYLHRRLSQLVAAILFVATVSPATVMAEQCPYGRDQCLPGYVWREAFTGDHVCVTGEVRAQTIQDNALAADRREPGGGAYGPDTCRAGYVWREARSSDHVCVSGETRVQAANDNIQAANRKDPQCTEVPTNGSLGVLSLNVFGMAAPQDVPWETRARRIAEWASRHQIVPDIVSLQEVWGWMWPFPLRDCGRGFAQGVGDYDQVDILLRELQDALGVTYRVAYLTGKQGIFGGLPCDIYSAQTMLYNPARLRNITAQQDAVIAHDATDRLDNIPHLRRSLPLCTRGTHLMPLESLIDGQPQYDKCGRATPSGPAYAVFNSQGHIAASFVQFSFVEQPDRTIDIFNIHPNSEREANDKLGVQKLLETLTPPPYAYSSYLYPPILTGDFNSWNIENEFPGFSTVLQPTNLAEPSAIGIGTPESVPSKYLVRAAEKLLLPDLPDGEKCGGSADNLVSDHCGLFVRFDLDGTQAGVLRKVFIDGPQQVETGSSYRLQATPAGEGPFLFRWEPGQTTSPTLNATAEAAGTTVWTVYVTDQQTGNEVSATHSVLVVAPPSEDHNSCVSLCRQERSACMAEVSQPSGPRPAQCAAEYKRCLADCPP